MRRRPTALGWIDPGITVAPDWDAAQVRQLARRLGYALIWPRDASFIPLVDQVRNADVEALIAPSPAHLDVIQLHAVMCVADVETACPRMSFARWATIATGRLG